MPLSNGFILNGRYRIESLITPGSSGNVYRAWDLNLNTPVALKEDQDDSLDVVGRFMRESRALANLRHENLPYVIDHFSLPGQGQYLVMEYIEGQDLQTLMARAKQGLSEARVLPWIVQVCDALMYLHFQSPPIFHRDVKPANIKVTPQGRVVLVDFGAARFYGPSTKTTVVARPMGQGFKSPEQLEGGAIDARSDIYALGATLYAVLSGRSPPDSLQRKMGMALPPPRQFNPAITPQTEHAILRAMELEPSQRFSSIAEFRDSLGNLASMPVAPTQIARGPAAYDIPDGQEAALASPAKSRGWIILAVAAFSIVCLFGGLLAGVGFYWFIYSPAQATATQAFPGLSETSTALASLLTSPALPVISTATETATPSLFPTIAPTLTPFPTSTFLPTLPPSLTPSITSTSLPQATWQPCSGTYPSRLQVGMRAYISYNPPLPNRVRSQPNVDSTILGYLQVGERMEIFEGPVCSNQWIWWRVRSLDTGLTGWTAEGDAQNYWLVPLP